MLTSVEIKNFEEEKAKKLREQNQPIKPKVGFLKKNHDQ